MECDRDSQVLYGRVGSVAPAHRGVGLAKCFAPMMEAIGHAMGLGLVYSLATPKTPAMQRAFEAAGWQLIRIMPGFDREVVAPGVVRRVFEAIYVKVLASEGDLLRPDAEGMRPATKALFETLFSLGPTESPGTRARTAAGAGWRRHRRRHRQPPRGFIVAIEAGDSLEISEQTETRCR